MNRLFAFIFDDGGCPTIDLAVVAPDPELAARNAARIEEAKRTLGDKYILAKPINDRSNVIPWPPTKEQSR